MDTVLSLIRGNLSASVSNLPTRIKMSKLENIGFELFNQHKLA